VHQAAFVNLLEQACVWPTGGSRDDVHAARDAVIDEDRLQTRAAISERDDLGVVGSSDGSEVSTDQRRDVGAAPAPPL
jgi:hypothetical protein